jgi:c-di-GMP-binding flagellar brake protein YcgR
MEERRRFVRLNVSVKVEYKVLETAAKEIHSTLTKDISGGGICLIGDEELNTGRFLELKIYLPKEQEPILSLGRVVWSKPFIIGDEITGKRFDIGIEFIKIDDTKREKINQYIFSYIKTADKQN